MKLGIDLGTTYCLGVIRKDGETKIVPNSFEETTTPSIIHNDGKGTISVGKIAKERRILDPENTIETFKRDMGSDKTITLNGKSFTPTQLSSIMIQQLINDAEQFTGEKVDEVVVSVPAYFTDAQRVATRNAARMCNVEIHRIINEPSSAALAYYAINRDDGLYLVFDFGGGTLDVTLVDIFDNIVDIVSISGDSHLGGADIDHVIFEHFMRENPSFSALSLSEKAVLLNHCETLKIQLAKSESAAIQFNHNGQSETLEIDRETLTELSSPILTRVLNVIDTVLRNSGYELHDITSIITVGGSSKSFIIQEFLKQLTGLSLNISMNPNEAIVIGLGTVIGIMEREAAIKDIILTDVCPFSLGIGIIGDVFSTIIEKNTALPTTRESYYVNAYDDQEKITMKVYQGEHLTASKNNLLDEIVIDIPKRKKDEVNFVCRFTYDINGILDIELEGMDFELNLSKTVHTNSELTAADMIEARERLDSINKAESNLSLKQRWLIERANALYIQVPYDKKEALYEKTKEFKIMLDKHVTNTQARVLESDFSTYLETIEEFVIPLFKTTSNPKRMN